MKTKELVGQYAVIEHLPAVDQRRMLQLARNYQYSKLGFYRYFIRFVGAPMAAMALVGTLPWVLLPVNFTNCLLVFSVSGLVGYALEHYLYLKMLKEGIVLYRNNPSLVHHALELSGRFHLISQLRL